MEQNYVAIQCANDNSIVRWFFSLKKLLRFAVLLRKKLLRFSGFNSYGSQFNGCQHLRMYLPNLVVGNQPLWCTHEVDFLVSSRTIHFCVTRK
jgi:hypothetical protein